MCRARRPRRTRVGASGDLYLRDRPSVGQVKAQWPTGFPSCPPRLGRCTSRPRRVQYQVLPPTNRAAQGTGRSCLTTRTRGSGKHGRSWQAIERQAGPGSTPAGQPQAAGRSTDTWSRRPAQAPAAGRPHQADHRHQAHPARPAAGQRWPVGLGRGYRPGECERCATRHSPPCHIPTPSLPQRPARRRLASLRHLHRRHPPPLDQAGQAMLEARQRSPERPPASAHAASGSPVARAGRQLASPRPRLRPPAAHRSWQSVPLLPPTRRPRCHGHAFHGTNSVLRHARTGLHRRPS
jgi:hypothetical protein